MKPYLASETGRPAADCAPPTVRSIIIRSTNPVGTLSEGREANKQLSRRTLPHTQTESSPSIKQVEERRRRGGGQVEGRRGGGEEEDICTLRKVEVRFRVFSP